MLQVACDQSRRSLMLLLNLTAAQILAPSVLTSSEISLLFLSGDLPQLDRLVHICGEHYLLYRELLDIKALPSLRISDGLQAGLMAG